MSPRAQTIRGAARARPQNCAPGEFDARQEILAWKGENVMARPIEAMCRRELERLSRELRPPVVTKSWRGDARELEALLEAKDLK